jgi:hypothetical protein
MKLVIKLTSEKDVTKKFLAENDDIASNQLLSEEEINEVLEIEKMTRPEQYRIGIDTFERMKANCTDEEIIGACKLNIDKYIWRKKDSDIEDLRKAKDYIDLWIEILEGSNTNILFRLGDGV